MIRQLRQRHRRTVIVLGIFLPIAFAAGVIARRPVPVVGGLPAVLLKSPQRFETTEWERAGLFAKVPVHVRLSREQKNSGGFALSLSAAKNFTKPDLLVYCSAPNENITDRVPTDAVLLGAFVAAALPLPGAIVKSGGVLVLYSLADGEIVDVSKPVQFDATGQNAITR